MAANIINTKKIASGFDVIITKPKKNKDNQLQIGLLESSTMKPFYFEIPEFMAYFGLSKYDPTKNGSDDTKLVYSLPLSAEFVPGETINTDEMDPVRAARINEQKLFMDMLENINEKLIQYGIDNSKILFGKNYPNTEAGRENFKEFVYSSPLKHSAQRDPKTNDIIRHYADRLNIKVPHNKEFTGPDARILFFKDSLEPITINNWAELETMVPKGKPVKAILQPRIFATPQKFGLTFRIVQVKLPEIQRVGRPMTYAFSEKPLGLVENKPAAEEKHDDTHAADSDAGEDVDVGED